MCEMCLHFESDFALVNITSRVVKIFDGRSETYTNNKPWDRVQLFHIRVTTTAVSLMWNAIRQDLQWCKETLLTGAIKSLVGQGVCILQMWICRCRSVEYIPPGASDMQVPQIRPLQLTLRVFLLVRGKKYPQSCLAFAEQPLGILTRHFTYGRPTYYMFVPA